MGLRGSSAGAAPRSANRTPPEGALSEQGWMDYRRGCRCGQEGL